MAKTKGRVTLPSEAGFIRETKEMLARWGADALRDSDGTKLDPRSKSWMQRFTPPILWPEGTMNLHKPIWKSVSSSI